MNLRPEPQHARVMPINTASNTDVEIQQCFSALNQLIVQFNQLTSLQGSLQANIEALFKRIAGTYPYDGTDEHDKGYISNEVLKNWPNANFEVGAVISNVQTPLLDIDIPNATTTFTAEAGLVSVLGGSTGNGGGGQVALDDAGAYGMMKDGSNLMLGIGSGVLEVAGNGGVKVGGTGTFNGLEFVSGLYISGSVTGSGGLIDDPPGPSTEMYARYNAVGSPNPTDGAVWYSLSTFFPNLTVGTDWEGSTSITQLGTVTAGTWEADPIGLDYIVNVAAYSLLGNNTNADAYPASLNATAVKTMLALENVENVALSTWHGTTQITQIGAASATSLTTETGNITTVNATTGNITTVNSTTGNITTVAATTVGATTGNITTVNATTVNTTTVSASGNIGVTGNVTAYRFMGAGTGNWQAMPGADGTFGFQFLTHSGYNAFSIDTTSLSNPVCTTYGDLHVGGTGNLYVNSLGFVMAKYFYSPQQVIFRSFGYDVDSNGVGGPQGFQFICPDGTNAMFIDTRTGYKIMYPVRLVLPVS